MAAISVEQLAEILKRHQAWLLGEPGGSRADLGGAILRDANLRVADLRVADLRGAILSGAILSGAILRDADLRGADLSVAVLRDANLRVADLRVADLRGAILRGADLSGAILRDADLRGADLSDADLRDANLRGADLSGADLRDANLRGADLRDANLRGADLRGAILSPVQAARLSIVPESGSYTGWKKCRGDRIVRLLIPSDARRSNAIGRKCRAEFAVVEAICHHDGTEAAEATSLHDESFVYRVGETVRCHEWCEDRWVECGGGVHHYISRVEAEHHT